MPITLSSFVHFHFRQGRRRGRWREAVLKDLKRPRCKYACSNAVRCETRVIYFEMVFWHTYLASLIRSCTYAEVKKKALRYMTIRSRAYNFVILTWNLRGTLLLEFPFRLGESLPKTNFVPSVRRGEAYAKGGGFGAKIEKVNSRRGMDSNRCHLLMSATLLHV